MKQPLLDLSFDELRQVVVEFGEKSYRSKQIFDILLKNKEISAGNLPKALIQKLEEKYEFKPVSVLKQLTDSTGDCTKFLFKLCDDEIVEGVLMKYKYGNTFCLSTQVGCRMGCAFCASGLNGLVRNLSAGEMLAMIVIVNSLDGAERNITNIVLMGSGEPLDNLDNVAKFLNLVTSENSLNISARNISLSTCGLADKIKLLPDLIPPVTLSISLHSTTDENRKKIMPIANAFSIKEVMEAAKYYFDKTGRRVAIEYSLIKGINDSDEDVKRLRELTKNFSCHVNVINLNSVKERNLIGLTRKEAYKFCDKLVKAGVSATVRRIMGEEIDGACGQLRAKHLNGGKNEKSKN